MKSPLQNNAASIRARLLNIAKETHRDFNAVLLQYFQERFLYRLSVSPYKNNFVLKGALLFLVFEVSRLRPTKDIDLLGISTASDPTGLAVIFQEISQITADDGVEYLPDSIRTEIIKEEQKYEGLRVKLEARLTSAKKIVQIDIAFGDPVVPKVQNARFPVLLDQAVPEIQTYSRESVIAEKFEAIVSLNVLTSRMKDFYDLNFLARQFSYNRATLAKAIGTTFDHRNTSLSDRFIVFSQEFSQDKDKSRQWQAFLNRNELKVEGFQFVMSRIREFLEPVCKVDPVESAQTWNNAVWEWQ